MRHRHEVGMKALIIVQFFSSLILRLKDSCKSLVKVICMMASFYYQDHYGEANLSNCLFIPKREDKFE